MIAWLITLVLFFYTGEMNMKYIVCYRGQAGTTGSPVASYDSKVEAEQQMNKMLPIGLVDTHFYIKEVEDSELKMAARYLAVYQEDGTTEIRLLNIKRFGKKWKSSVAPLRGTWHPILHRYVYSMYQEITASSYDEARLLAKHPQVTGLTPKG